MTRHVPAALFAAVLLFLFALLATAPAAQAPQVGRSVVHGVRIPVAVTRSGRPVAELKAADFDVRDQHVPQQVESAAAVGYVALAIVVDASLSVREREFDRTLKAIKALAALLEPGDRATLVAFSDRVVTLVPPTDDAAALERGVDAVPRKGTGPASVSAVWDAAMAGASLVATAEAQPLVVLFSDGMDNASWLDKSEVASTLMRSGIPLDWVKMPWNRASLDRFGPGRQTPEALPEKTGGHIYLVEDRGLDGKLGSRLAELRACYVLTYTPHGVKIGDGWHDVEVHVRSENATVRARPGYWSSGEK